jgi:hypothetical protein
MIAESRTDHSREEAAQLAQVWKQKRDSSIVIDEEVSF